MDIYDEIKECSEQLKKLIVKRSDIRAVQTVQLRLQVLYNDEMERRRKLKITLDILKELRKVNA